MLDPRTLLDPATDAHRKLARRGHDLDQDSLQSLFEQRNGFIQAGDEARAESKRIAAEVQATGRRGDDPSQLIEKARGLKARIQEIEEQERTVQGELDELLLGIPNLPDDRVPDGDSEEQAQEVSRWGDAASFGFEARDHVELGEKLGIVDQARAAKLSGARFSLLKGPGAALERALTSFLLNLHTTQHDYTEYAPPSLVTRDTMTGSGQLPKFEQDLFLTSTGDRELFLIPTAEVPLVNLYAGEAIPDEQLPLGMTAHTPCYRSEAGSHGRDTRGMIRLHEFSKVELVRVCAAEESSEQLEVLRGHAETCLRQLGLAYRVIVLPAGDMGFAATFTYDIEVWLPGQQQYREISSVSDCGTFQARRCGIRQVGRDKKRSFVATLNGSGLPLGRTLVAILEQGQRADGSVVIPEVLAPYTGFTVINADGSTG